MLGCRCGIWCAHWLACCPISAQPEQWGRAPAVLYSDWPLLRPCSVEPGWAQHCPIAKGSRCVCEQVQAGWRQPLFCHEDGPPVEIVEEFCPHVQVFPHCCAGRAISSHLVAGSPTLDTPPMPDSPLWQARVKLSAGAASPPLPSLCSVRMHCFSTMFSSLLWTVQDFDGVDVLWHESAFCELFLCIILFSPTFILLAFPLLKMDVQLWFAAALDWYTGSNSCLWK